MRIGYFSKRGPEGTYIACVSEVVSVVHEDGGNRIILMLPDGINYISSNKVNDDNFEHVRRALLSSGVFNFTIDYLNFSHDFFFVRGEDAKNFG